ncbi:MAG: nucleotidyltransferase family protein [Acidimicrobiales bacterium]
MTAPMAAMATVDAGKGNWLLSAPLYVTKDLGVVYGSVARDEAREGSDIDLLVDMAGRSLLDLAGRTGR